MVFDLQHWRNELAGHLQGWPQQMAQLNITSAYSYLVTLALLPVAQAANRGEWAAIGALFSVAGTIGGNILSSQLQYLADRVSTPEGQRTLAAWVEAEAPYRAEVQTALDQVLTQLGVLEAAKQHLRPAEHAWFAILLQGE